MAIKKWRFFLLSIPVHSFENAKKQVRSFENVKSMKCASLGVIFFFALDSSQNCRYLSMNTNICICATHDNAKLSILLHIFCVAFEKCTILLFLPPLLMCHPLAFFSPFSLCSFFVRFECRHEYSRPNSSTFFTFRPTVTGQFHRVFV